MCGGITLAHTNTIGVQSDIKLIQENVLKLKPFPLHRIFKPITSPIPLQPLFGCSAPFYAQLPLRSPAVYQKSRILLLSTQRNFAISLHNM